MNTDVRRFAERRKVGVAPGPVALLRGRHHGRYAPVAWVSRREMSQTFAGGKVVTYFSGLATNW